MKVADRSQDETVRAHWDQLYTLSDYSKALGVREERAVHRALEHFGDVRGRSLLDIGCGRGASTLFFAEHGARVTAIDISPVAVASLEDRARRLGLRNVRGVVHSALRPDALGTFDFIYGSMILHHIEPLGEFARAADRALRPGGRAFFYENNATSAVLRWFRANAVGRFGIPKKGDPDEHPLTRDEIDEMRRHFSVRIEIPEMYFFRLASIYLLRGTAEWVFAGIDDGLFRLGILTSHSYRQFLLMEKKMRPAPVLRTVVNRPKG